jgi:hypothetical protein
MTLKDLFDVVPDDQKVILRDEELKEIIGRKKALNFRLRCEVFQMTVFGVESSYDGELKVWVKENEH